MKAVKWYDPTTQSFLVAVCIGEDKGEKVWAPPYGSGMSPTRSSPGAQIPVYLRLSDEEAAAMGLHADDYVEQKEASGRHLDDALEVRDRLLTLIEQEFPK